MPKMLLPDARFRSPTAVSGKSDVRDENVYSAVVLQDTGTGSTRIFKNPSGQAIPKLNGSRTASTAAHHGNYSDLTTNLDKAGELGSGIGDAAIRAMGVTIEQAAYTASTGALRSFGASPFETADILSKVAFEFKVGGKRQIIGPVWAFPQLGGVYGQLATTATGATVGINQNGGATMSRKIKLPIQIARNDTIEGLVSVAGGASLAFSVTSGEGQPVLVWFHLLALVKGDVR